MFGCFNKPTTNNPFPASKFQNLYKITFRIFSSLNVIHEFIYCCQCLYCCQQMWHLIKVSRAAFPICYQINENEFKHSVEHLILSSGNKSVHPKPPMNINTSSQHCTTYHISYQTRHIFWSKLVKVIPIQLSSVTIMMSVNIIPIRV